VIVRGRRLRERGGRIVEVPAEAGPKVAQGMQAIGNALPSITKALDDASRAIDRAAANMPDPTYPKR